MKYALPLVVPLLVLAAYVFVWRPVRVWSAVHVFGPMLTQAAGTDWRVVAQPAPPGVVLTRGAETHKYSVPAGRLFLVPALVLAGLAPRRRLWLRLFGVLLALGLLDAACVLVGTYTGVGWALHDFLSAYVAVPLSVGLPMLWLHAERRVNPLAVDAAPEVAPASEPQP